MLTEKLPWTRRRRREEKREEERRREGGGGNSEGRKEGKGLKRKNAAHILLLNDQLVKKEQSTYQEAKVSQS